MKLAKVIRIFIIKDPEINLILSFVAGVFGERQFVHHTTLHSSLNHVTCVSIKIL